MISHFFLIAIFFAQTKSSKCSEVNQFAKKLQLDFGIEDIGEIAKQEFISEDSVGKVYKLIYTNPKAKAKFAAAKIAIAVSKKDEENLNRINHLKKEIQLLEDFTYQGNSKMPQFIACYVDNLMAVLLMEFLPLNLDPCNLDKDPVNCKKHSFNEEFVKLPVSRQLFYFSEILSAIDGLHQNNLVHHSIKPENIMLTEPNKKDEREVRLYDFRTLAEEGRMYNGATMYYADYETWAFWETMDYRFLTESLRNNTEKKADIYAAAITFFVILNGLQNEIAIIKKDANIKLTERMAQINKIVSSPNWMADKKILVCTKDKKICFEKLMQEMLTKRSKRKTAKELAESFKKLAEHVKKAERVAKMLGSFFFWPWI